MMTCYVATKHTDEPYHWQCRIALAFRWSKPIEWIKLKKKYGLVKKRVPVLGDVRGMVLFMSESDFDQWRKRHGKAQG